MLIDALQCSDSEVTVPRGGLCIIGSGIGAGSLAMELHRAGVPFVVIEAGGMKKLAQDVIESESVGAPFRLGKPTRAIALGGTSNLWGNSLKLLDKFDFRARAWIPHSGWPIEYHDLAAYYGKAMNVLGASDRLSFDPNALSADLKDYVSAMPYDRKILENTLLYAPLKRTNLRDSLAEITQHSDKHHCYYNLCAVELVGDDAGRIRHVVAGRRHGKFMRVCADRFVVCAGTLETPRLLLNSGFNNHNIGRFLMDHPMGNLAQVTFRDTQRAHIYAGMRSGKNLIKLGLRINESLQEEESLPNHCFYIRPSFACAIEVDGRVGRVRESLSRLRHFKKTGFFSGDIWTVLWNAGLAGQILKHKFFPGVRYRKANLFFYAEQIPNPASTVALSARKDRFGFPVAKINWQFSEQDLEALRRQLDLLKRRVFSGAPYRSFEALSVQEMSEKLCSGTHHLGTARMAHSAGEGVVDRDLRVFGASNLYVCDGSVFPTAGNANCGLTISALACRLANHLGQQA